MLSLPPPHTSLEPCFSLTLSLCYSCTLSKTTARGRRNKCCIYWCRHCCFYNLIIFWLSIPRKLTLSEVLRSVKTYDRAREVSLSDHEWTLVSVSLIYLDNSQWFCHILDALVDTRNLLKCVTLQSCCAIHCPMRQMETTTCSSSAFHEINEQRMRYKKACNKR